jgi:hypothetical protein
MTIDLDAGKPRMFRGDGSLPEVKCRLRFDAGQFDYPNFE